MKSLSAGLPVPQPVPCDARKYRENKENEDDLEQVRYWRVLYLTHKEAGERERRGDATPCPKDNEFPRVPLANVHIPLLSLARMEIGVNRSGVDLKSPCTAKTIDGSLRSVQ